MAFPYHSLFPLLHASMHALHHKNSDIDCFAGFAMHPLEHLYYFSAVSSRQLVGMQWGDGHGLC